MAILLLVMNLGGPLEAAGSSTGSPAGVPSVREAPAPEAHEIEGRVRDRATGAAVAATLTWRTAADETSQSVTTDAKGVFRAALRGRATVTVTAPGYRPLETHLEPKAGQPLPAEFRLEPLEPPAELQPERVRGLLQEGYTLLHGHVMDSATGRPMVGVRVRADGLPRDAFTDIRGYFTLSLPVPRNVSPDGGLETVSLRIREPGYKTHVVANTALIDGGETHLLIDLERGQGETLQEGSRRPTEERDANGTLAAPSSCATHPGEDACTGKDPVEAGCGDDATTFSSAPILQRGQLQGTVELRYSARCQSSWVRVQSGGPVPLSVRIQREDGRSFAAERTGLDVWTPMVFGSASSIRACGSIDGREKCAPAE